MFNSMKAWNLGNIIYSSFIILHPALHETNEEGMANTCRVQIWFSPKQNFACVPNSIIRTWLDICLFP